MNTNAIFYSSFTQYKVLRETSEYGITRIEISYYADSEDAEAMLYEKEFQKQYEEDFLIVRGALAKVKNLFFKVHMKTLFETFRETMKKNQLFVL